MIRNEPVIAVQDVDASATWYQTLFDCNRSHGHGGDKFEILTDDEGSVLLCLHEWEVDQHPTMMDTTITPGNGLILYFRTDRLEQIRNQAEKLDTEIERDIERSPNSGEEEFSIRDLDCYYLTISSYHDYGHGYK
ncbi:VOC family protein [Fodinibius halophilus]|uniref:VOC family protein n=1 Tax=Fodinibius halophilus TaxID=1736908 RepID=A0A6M1T6Y1_9BACT|nr:VOC family protein [Fodinibius halophilus]NGP89937.1 VOC family protein [Fodinibius halophilus]